MLHLYCDRYLFFHIKGKLGLSGDRVRALTCDKKFCFYVFEKTATTKKKQTNRNKNVTRDLGSASIPLSDSRLRLGGYGWLFIKNN